MKEFKAMAHINSLNGKLAEITVLENVGDNDYIVDTTALNATRFSTGLSANITPTTFTR